MLPSGSADPAAAPGVGQAKLLPTTAATAAHMAQPTIAPVGPSDTETSAAALPSVSSGELPKHAWHHQSVRNSLCLWSVACAQKRIGSPGL